MKFGVWTTRFLLVMFMGCYIDTVKVLCADTESRFSVFANTFLSSTFFFFILCSVDSWNANATM